MKMGSFHQPVRYNPHAVQRRQLAHLETEQASGGAQLPGSVCDHYQRALRARPGGGGGPPRSHQARHL